MISQFIANGLEAGAAYGLVALGFGLIFRVCGFFNFAHGAVYTVAGYLAFTFIHICGFSPWIGIPLAMIGAAGLGATTEMAIYRPMRRRGASSLTLLICSLGALVAIGNAVSLVFGDETKRLRTIDIYPSVIVLGAHVTTIQFVIIGTSILITVAVSLWMRMSNFGKMVRAVADDTELAASVGIKSESVILIVFILGSALAAIASILIGYDTDLTPAIGFNTLLMAVVAVIVGGIGSVPGSFFGGMLVGLAQNLGVWKLPTQWQNAIVFAILVIFLLVRPQGFFGKPLKHALN
jgi:branched-chain amino acid transport system permease protein